MKYYECKKCGNVMNLFEDSGVIPVCCGSTMLELKPLSEDGGYEKHVPVVEIKDNEVIVSIGEIAHPMLDEHYIKWIILETSKGKYIRSLKPNVAPVVKFYINSDETPLYVYAYCNVHSLWTKKL